MKIFGAEISLFSTNLNRFKSILIAVISVMSLGTIHVISLLYDVPSQMWPLIDANFGFSVLFTVTLYCVLASFIGRASPFVIFFMLVYSFNITYLNKRNSIQLLFRSGLQILKNQVIDEETKQDVKKFFDPLIGKIESMSNYLHRFENYIRYVVTFIVFSILYIGLMRTVFVFVF